MLGTLHVQEVLRGDLRSPSPVGWRLPVPNLGVMGVSKGLDKSIAYCFRSQLRCILSSERLTETLAVFLLAWLTARTTTDTWRSRCKAACALL